MMGKMGFNNRWIGLILACIQSVTYSIVLNGQPHGFITPTCGLRQGDPLSPYLFLLVTDGLHALLKKAEDDGDLRGGFFMPCWPSGFSLVVYRRQFGFLQGYGL